MPYIDDIIIYSKTIEEHLEHIKEVFRRLKEVGFHLKLRKYEFFIEQMKFLGYTIKSDQIKTKSEQGYTCSKDKVQHEEFPQTRKLLPEIHKKLCI
jgi:hypothetical protein